MWFSLIISKLALSQLHDFSCVNGTARDKNHSMPPHNSLSFGNIGPWYDIKAMFGLLEHNGIERNKNHFSLFGYFMMGRNKFSTPLLSNQQSGMNYDFFIPISPLILKHQYWIYNIGRYVSDLIPPSPSIQASVNKWSSALKERKWTKSDFAILCDWVHRIFKDRFSYSFTEPTPTITALPLLLTN